MQILRDEWGYKEIVVSDCWAISDFYNKGAHETDPENNTLPTKPYSPEQMWNVATAMLHCPKP